MLTREYIFPPIEKECRTEASYDKVVSSKLVIVEHYAPNGDMRLVQVDDVRDLEKKSSE